MNSRPKHVEARFEDAIEVELLAHGYVNGDPTAFDAERGLFPADVVAYVKASQAKKWQSLLDLQGSAAEATMIDAIVKELAVKGSLHVLRHGFKCFGKTYQMAAFQPASSMNPDAIARVRTEHSANHAAGAGEPCHIANHRRCALGQRAPCRHGRTQEPDDRTDGRERQAAIRQRPRPASSAVPLQGAGAGPFRRRSRSGLHDHEAGWKGNRLAAVQSRQQQWRRKSSQARSVTTARYLWEEVLGRDSLMDILARFVHLAGRRAADPHRRRASGRAQGNDDLPALPPARRGAEAGRPCAAIRARAATTSIQHSAGSGKSNSIAWLAHRLASLHDANGQESFSFGGGHHRPARARSAVAGHDLPVRAQEGRRREDRREHPAARQGALPRACRSSSRPIQKFPFISQALRHPGKKGEAVKIDTAGKRFAVIVDEAHSSQSGETATALKGILNKDGIEAAIAAQMLDDGRRASCPRRPRRRAARNAQAPASAEPQLFRLHRHARIQDQGRSSTSRGRWASRRSTCTPCARPSRRASSWTCSRTTRPTSATSG